MSVILIDYFNRLFFCFCYIVTIYRVYKVIFHLLWIIKRQPSSKASPSCICKVFFILNSRNFIWTDILQIIISNNKTIYCKTSHSHTMYSPNRVQPSIPPYRLLSMGDSNNYCFSLIGIISSI